VRKLYFRSKFFSSESLIWVIGGNNLSDNIGTIIESDEYSGEFIPFYEEDPNDDPQNLRLKKLHNKLAFEAQKKGKEANIQSDNLNSKFSPSFRTAKIVKQIPSYITIIFGIVTTLQGFALFRGSVTLTPEFVGITSAGKGIF
jgi:hypothetical protein